jgi:oligoribonuclease
MFFLWVDCEMTGLEFERDHILEIACIITDANMNVIVEYNSVIFQTNEILERMNDWCKNTHTSSGLIDLVKESNKNYSQVEYEIMTLLRSHATEKEIYIAGNSVYTDLYFIKKHMPLIADFVHYRIFDISSFKILGLKKNIVPFIKNNNHTALRDIRESIAEYQYYQNVLFKNDFCLCYS